MRGGYGIYYAPIHYQADWLVNALGVINGKRQIAEVFTTIQTSGPAANNIFSVLRAQGVIGSRSITDEDIAQFGINVSHTGPLPPFAVLVSASPNLVNSYSQQASLSIERELSEGLAVSVGYTFVRTLKIPRQRDKNLRAPVDPSLGIRVWSDPVRDFVDPLIAQDNVFESTAPAAYSGMIVEVQKG